MLKTFIGIVIIVTFFLLGCSNNAKHKEKSNIANKEVVDTIKLQIDSLTKAIRQTPENDALFYQRGNLYFINGDISKAVNDIEIAKKLNPDSALYYLDLSEIELRRGESGIAKNILEGAHERFPENVEVMVRLANIHMAVEQYKQARTYLIKASRVEPRNARLYLISSMIFQQIDMIDKAIDELYLAIKYDPNYYDAHVMLGLLTAKQNKDIAIDHYLNAIRTNDQNPEAYYNLAMYYQNSGKFEKALQTYRKGLNTIDSTLQHFLFNSAFVYENYMDKPDSALLYYQKVINYFPDDYRVYYRMGMCYEMIGEENKAMASYDMCLKVNPNYEEAFEALSRLSEKLNKNR
jgi:protein O-GlcNAc transferase